MKKPIQNVLARHSNQEIIYLCQKCAKPVDKKATVCTHCGARLGDIRCPFCNFIGSVDDFANDTCPQCGRKSNGNKKTKKKRSALQQVFSNRLFWTLFVILFSIIVALLYLFINIYDIF